MSQQEEGAALPCLRPPSEPQRVGSSGIVCLTGAQAEILGNKGPVVFAQGWANDGAAGQVLR